MFQSCRFHHNSEVLHIRSIKEDLLTWSYLLNSHLTQTEHGWFCQICLFDSLWNVSSVYCWTAAKRPHESLTCLPLLGLPYAIHVWVHGNNSHIVDGVGIQVPQGGGGGASRHLLLFSKTLKPPSVRRRLDLITVRVHRAVWPWKRSGYIIVLVTIRSSPPGSAV